MQKVEEFLVALQQGRCPDRRRLLDEFPALADELAECLDAMEFVQQATPQLNGQAQAGDAGAAAEDGRALDTSFGNGGKAMLDFGALYNTQPPSGTAEEARAVAIDAAGYIAVAGRVEPYDFAVALLKPDGCPDVSFGTSGKATTNFGASDSATGVAFDSAGRIVVAGTAAPGTGSDIAVVRYLGHDPVVDAGSATLAADLQAALHRAGYRAGRGGAATCPARA